MTYPQNFEEKIGFDKIRHFISERCLSTLGSERVNEMKFLTSFDTIERLLRETEEFTHILQSEDVLAQVSYKDMFGVYDYAVGVSAQADFALLFPLDALAAPDFVKTQAEGIRSAQALLRSIDYPLFLNIITYLPDIPAFLCALCVHAASLENFDIAAFSSAAEWVGRTAGANLDAALLTDYFSYLAECSPDDLSGSARAKAEEFADYLKAAFPS